MTRLANRLVDDVLSLPGDERAEIAERLLESLNAPFQKEIDRAWTRIAVKRLREIESGHVKPIPASEVFSRVLRRRKAK